jgi:hypothetical protein
MFRLGIAGIGSLKLLTAHIPGWKWKSVLKDAIIVIIPPVYVVVLQVLAILKKEVL